MAKFQEKKGGRGTARGHRSHRERTFALDGAFLKREASVAIKEYFMPMSGLYAALTGKEVIMVQRDRHGKIIDSSKPSASNDDGARRKGAGPRKN